MKRGKAVTAAEVAQILILRRTLTVRQTAEKLQISKTTVQQYCPGLIADAMKLVPVADDTPSAEVA
jgi:predicted transcriptional regulator